MPRRKARTVVTTTTTTPTTPSSALVMFTAEDGTVSTLTNGFQLSGAAGWSSSTSNPYTGSRSYAITFGPDALDLNGRQGSADLDIAFPSAMPEVWARYKMRIPDNRYHRVHDANYGKTDNEKGLLTVVAGPYPTGYTSGNLQVIVEHNACDASGSYLYQTAGTTQYTRYSYMDGLFRYCSSRSVSGYLYNGISGTNKLIFTDSDRGSWVEYIITFKFSSSTGVSDGYHAVWKKVLPGGSYVKCCEVTGADFYESGKTGWQWMRILGASNAGYTDATTYNVDEIEVAASNLWGVS